MQARGQLRLTWKLYAESPQSGEISRPYGTASMAVGDLSALSHNRAEVPLLQYRPLPPLEMTIVAGSIQSFQRGTQIEKMLHRIRHFDRSGAEWRNLTPLWYSGHGGRKLYHPYRPLPPPEMTHGQTGSPKKVKKKAPRKGELFWYFRLLRLLPFWCGSTEVQRHRPGWPRQ